MVEDMNKRIVTIGSMHEINRTMHVTRKGDQDGIIDDMWNNYPRRLVKMGVIPNGESNYDILWGRIRNMNLDLKQEMVEKRSWRNYI